MIRSDESFCDVMLRAHARFEFGIFLRRSEMINLILSLSQKFHFIPNFRFLSMPEKYHEFIVDGNQTKLFELNKK